VPALRPHRSPKARAIVNTFMAPSKTFTDLRPQRELVGAVALLLSDHVLAFFYVVGQKDRLPERSLRDQVQASAETAARKDPAAADQRGPGIGEASEGHAGTSFMGIRW